MTNPNNSQQIVQIISTGNISNQWQPHAGLEVSELLQHLNVPQTALRQSSIDILSQCVNPNSNSGNSTGIVIGNVQSGKTMSFTTVAALARDNNFQLIVVITGTSKPLFNQSSDRLERDLRLNTRPDRKWVMLRNPQVQVSLHTIQPILDDWADTNVPNSTCRTILITVMKHAKHLGNLTQIFNQLPLQGVPILIIDDEADQAGLNTKVKQGNESTIYRQLLALRNTIPLHTYLQYTATPQAPLLINLIDQLSPKFTELLIPGANYTGGEAFFLDHPHLVETIPENDIPSDENELTGPPDSLLKAMALFYLGVAAGMEEDRNQDGIGNRSMLVHPSQKTMDHKQFFNWVRQTRQNWLDILDPKLSHPDYHQVLDGFKLAYDDLATNVSNIPSFTGLCKHLHRAIRKTVVREVNASDGPTPKINWRDHYSWILVGGQAMDRGYTVEGLTVTYMPRGIGVGNADTVQQRARFFGYKGEYLGYCRIFLEHKARETYTDYVKHEKDIRERLIEFKSTGQSLDKWKRAFFLDEKLKACRDNVLSLDYMRIHEDFSNKWYFPKAPHVSKPAYMANRTIVDAFIQKLNLIPDLGHPKRTQATKHEVDDAVDASKAFNELLVPFILTTSSDSTRHTGFLIQIGKYIQDHPSEKCVVYVMSKGYQRERTLEANDELNQKILFQGAQPDKATKTAKYPGDREKKEVDKLTIQIYLLTLKRPDGSTEQGVPVIVVWVPSKMSAGVYSQDHV
ncbi:MAG: Z1 domain-containing protein [Chloroflexota bacterium]